MNPCIPQKPWDSGIPVLELLYFRRTVALNGGNFAGSDSFDEADVGLPAKEAALPEDEAAGFGPFQLEAVGTGPIEHLSGAAHVRHLRPLAGGLSDAPAYERGAPRLGRFESAGFQVFRDEPAAIIAADFAGAGVHFCFGDLEGR